MKEQMLKDLQENLTNAENHWTEISRTIVDNAEQGAMDVDEQFELISGYVDTYLTDCDEETKEKFESICATILQNADEGATGAEDTLS
jgi:hypothetical protein